MLELTKTGLSREKSYKMVQSDVKKCFAEDLDLFNVIQSDKYIINKISSKKLKSIFSYSKHFKKVNLKRNQLLLLNVVHHLRYFCVVIWNIIMTRDMRHKWIAQPILYWKT